jgi:hypothetical protein
LPWPSRTFSEYCAKESRKHFNPELGDYLTVAFIPLVAANPSEQLAKDWTATVWERKPGVK